MAARPRAIATLAASVAAGASLAGVAACNAILGIEAFPDLDASTADGAPAGEAGEGAASDQSAGDVTLSDGTPGTTDAGPGDAIDAAPGDAGDSGDATSAGDARADAPDGAPACTGAAAVCAPSCFETGDAGVDAQAPADGLTTCNGRAPESCCTSLLVDGGSFLRSYDGVHDLDAGNPATVSSFALDKYEVTVGRFRNFVLARVGGWGPQPGTGIHTQVQGGLGVIDSAKGAHESGWLSAWDVWLPTDFATWNLQLACEPAPYASWTAVPDVNEQLPINCVDWFMAYAFCIWDGGFLPTEAEWDYAAAGGGGADGQRLYAWSSPPTSPLINCQYANFESCGGGPIGVDRQPLGAGTWGQQQLTANVWEWTLDFYADYVVPCTDCGYLVDPDTDGGATRVVRGGSYQETTDQLDVGNRAGNPVATRYGKAGVRCARAAP